MDTQHNKQMAHEFYRCFSESNITGVMATMTDDATYWIAGKPQSGVPCGELSKRQIEKLFLAMLARLKTGLKMTINSTIAEGDTVALEVVSRGELTNGRIYDQQYHVAMRFKDGKIASTREYLDTHRVVDIWFANNNQATQN